jgi:UPF0755 protein
MKRKILILLIFVLVCTGGIITFFYSVLSPEVEVRKGEKNAVLFIPTGSDYPQVLDSIESNLIIKDFKILNWIAQKKNYPLRIKPGRYIIEDGASYIELINMLRAGRQSPVNVTFNNIRTINDLAGKIGRQIEADSLEIIQFLNAPENYSADGFTKENIISVFLPDTYEMFWNTDGEGFYGRMLREYRRFWNEERLAKAREKNLNAAEVSVLASIVDDEAARSAEKPRIAGVYINRLKRGIPLQADPTVKFALSDPSITRILTKHLLVDSPYNTYRYKGLPPGPINCPSIQGINAVLDAEKHDYLYFAAKADFSGLHNFSSTLSQHNRYAAEYRRELNRRRIYR